MRLSPSSPALPPALALLKPQRFPGQLRQFTKAVRAPPSPALLLLPLGPGQPHPARAFLCTSSSHRTAARRWTRLSIRPSRVARRLSARTTCGHRACSPFGKRCPLVARTDGRGRSAAVGGRPLRPGSPQHYERTDCELQAERLQLPGSSGQSCDEDGRVAPMEKIRRGKKKNK